MIGDNIQKNISLYSKPTDQSTLETLSYHSDMDRFVGAAVRTEPQQIKGIFFEVKNPQTKQREICLYSPQFNKQTIENICSVQAIDRKPKQKDIVDSVITENFFIPDSKFTYAKLDFPIRELNRIGEDLQAAASSLTCLDVLLEKSKSLDKSISDIINQLSMKKKKFWGQSEPYFSGRDRQAFLLQLGIIHKEVASIKESMKEALDQYNCNIQKGKERIKILAKENP